MKTKSPQVSTQFIRYAAVGLTSNLLLYAGYLGLTSMGVGHKTAMTALYILGVVLTFIANKNWSFEHKGFSSVVFPRYVIAYLIGYMFNVVLLWVAVDHWHFPHQWVQFVAVFLVAGSLFIMQRYWVFAPARMRSDAT